MVSKPLYSNDKQVGGHPVAELEVFTPLQWKGKTHNLWFPI